MSKYTYPGSYQEEKRLEYLKDFASWLNRESSLPACNSFVPTRYKQASDARRELKKCPPIEALWKEYIRERALEHDPSHNQEECTPAALVHTRALIDTFFTKKGGKKGFCDSVTEYLERPEWDSDVCQKRLPSGRVQIEDIYKVYATPEGSGYTDICPYIEGAVKRASQRHQKFFAIEGKSTASHPRSRWLEESKKTYPHLFGSGRKLTARERIPPPPPPPPRFLEPRTKPTAKERKQQEQTFVSPLVLPSRKPTARQRRVNLIPPPPEPEPFVSSLLLPPSEPKLTAAQRRRASDIPSRKPTARQRRVNLIPPPPEPEPFVSSLLLPASAPKLTAAQRRRATDIPPPPPYE